MLNIKDGFGSDTNLATDFDSNTNIHIPIHKDADREELNNRLGPRNEPAPVTDVSSSGLNGRLQRIAQRLSSLISVFPTSLGQKTSDQSLPVVVSSDQSKLKVIPSNIIESFRESFDLYQPNTIWQEQVSSGDYVHLDGNAVGASYLVISKDPFNLDTTTITANLNAVMPLELSLGIHSSQRTLGQEFYIDVISNEEAQPSVPDLTISSISQTGTTLTVNTATAHNLTPGSRIGIASVSDSRLNYPSLVVASVPAPNQFTATAGPAGTIPTLTAGPFTSGIVYVRPALGYAKNGTSMVWEQPANTSASFYIKSSGREPHIAGGTLVGNHSVTVANTSSIQDVNSPYTYSFRPQTEYRLLVTPDRVQWQDSGIDSLGTATNRSTRNQSVPDLNTTYNLRIRAQNAKGLSRPVGKILSITKTGSTTATVVTDVAHGLTTADVVNIYGVRDQTNFPNLTSATSVTSIVNPTTFTIIIGPSATASSTGGYVARINGSNLLSSLGAIPQVISTAALSSGVLTLVGNASWTNLLIGDSVNIIGATNSSNNTLLGIDGAWKVRNVSGTTLELETLPGFVAPANFTTINAGGGLVKRTDLRISFIRLFSYERQRIETVPRPNGDESTSTPVRVQNTTTPPLSPSTSNIGYVLPQIPLVVVDIASAALTSTTTTSAITPAAGCSYQVNIPVTAVTGTSPTLDVIIQESDDSGTNWYNVYSFPRITASGIYRSPVLTLTGNRIRYVQTVGGTSPSFTRSLNRLQSFYPGNPVKQLIDRSIIPTTLNSVTPTLFTGDTTNFQLQINIGAASSPPSVQLEGSDDGGVTWYSIGSALAAVANSTTNLFIQNINAQQVRARISVAGTSVTLGYVLIKSWA